MKKRVKAISLPKLNNGTHFAFHDAVLARIETDAKIKQKVAPLLQAYRNAYIAEDKVLVLSKKNALTDEITQADNNRDAAYLAFKASVKAFSIITDPITQPAGKRLAQVLKDYKIQTNDPLSKQTGMMINLIGDLETNHKADIAALGLDIWVKFMRIGNDKVREAMSERTEQYSAKDLQAVKKARTAIDDAYDALIERLLAYALVEESKDFEAFFTWMDQHIDYYNRTYLKVKSKKSAAGDKTDTGTPSNTEDSGKDKNDPEIPDPVAPPTTPPSGGTTGGGDDGELPDPLA
jgi:hypothetical protein